MALPLSPPLQPQLAKSRTTLPEGEEWRYEPKYDGFRALAFVENEDVTLQSRSGRPLRRYFPELEFMPGRYVLDGEIIIGDPEGEQDFDALQQRLHPAESRVRRLAEETPARYVAFDLLASDDESLLDRPFHERRDALAALVAEPVLLAPFTSDPEQAAPWLQRAEGVIAKEADAPYRPGERKGMVKVKRVRTIDAVVAGWRPGKEEGTLGSLILGLYDAEGELHVVGHTSGFRAKEKRELPAKLAPYETGEPGTAEPSRGAADRHLEASALRPELVCEVAFDHVSARCIRHGAKMPRWRDDKPSAECTVDPLDG